MNINRYIKTTLRLLFLLSLSTLLIACEKEKIEVKPDPMSGGAITGVNYSGEGIQTFSVDGSWGGNVGRYSGGGSSVCCVTYPRKWSPALKVKVKWERSDCERQRHLCTLERALQHKWPKNKFLEKTIPIPEFTTPGEVYVLFFPQDEVQVHIVSHGFNKGSIPGDPGNPEDHNPERNK